ncbi:MAG: hypothetical protein ACLTJ5_12375 [Clostridium sp.]
MINIGAVISGRYEIIEKVGTGGMADVYRAKDHRLNRYVAVKILKMSIARMRNLLQNSVRRHRQLRVYPIQIS